MRKLKYIIVAITFLLFTINRLVISQSVTIDMGTEFQTIQGYGGIHINAWQGKDFDENLREKAFGNNPGEIGLSILRLRIDPDSNKFYSELPIAQHAVKNGALVFASPWQPPSEMLDPAYDGRRLHEDYYGNYVEHLNRFNKYMSDSGVSLYAISVQNEPDFRGHWTDWTAAEITKFLSENAQNIDTKVMAPESYYFARPFTDSILNDSGAAANLDIVAGHIYGGGLKDYPLARDKGKEVWMTEHLTGSESLAKNTWELALDLGNEIDSCMESNFNAYVWWYIRRFYGLIADDGNITKKGYVMSQFSKFIRRGYIRVQDTVKNAPGVKVSAFKTDSSLVIVVINKNDSDVNLDFTIQNDSIDTLTQFTTSATKNVVNDGGITVIGGLFNATIDAQSVTTFTTYAENGGNYGNTGPVADAGSDIVVDDLNGSGIDTVAIDGSSSSDSDGTIVNYSWSVDSMYYSSDTAFEFIASIGVHELVLTVTDNDGATDSDTITVTVNSPFSTEIWLEAECGEVGSTWEQTSDATASNGIYVATPSGTESLDNASTDTADLIVFTFDVSESGTYKVWGRVITPTANDDSYWVNMDNSTTWTRWNSIPAGNDWHWDDVHADSDDNPVGYNLNPGEHTLSICFREDGALLDKIYIANDGTVPSDMGDTATNCPEDSVISSNEFAFEDVTHISIFPNPASDEVQVVWDKGFNSLIVYNVDGRFMIDKKYPELIHVTNLNLELKQGIYFLLLSNEKTSEVAKLIIE